MKMQIGLADRLAGSGPGSAERRSAQPPSLWPDEDQAMRARLGELLQVRAQLGHDLQGEGHRSPCLQLRVVVEQVI
jgi:hypothetical protein